MADTPRRRPASRARQARQHLDTLKAGGVEWVPKTPAPTRKTAKAADPAATASLFDGEVDAPTAAPDPEQRRHELTVLAEKVSKCVRCAELAATRTQTVFGEGALDADICFIGEAPGADEDATGRPFVGAAGQLLNRIIAACGMKREEVYICNILRCRPPGNRLPLPHEAANCREWLEKTLEMVRPKYICALGACAAQNLLGTKLAIGKLRGQFHDYRGIPVLCTYHPAFLLRSPDRKKDVWEDLKKLLARMGRPVK
jgi:uracil-DNA glycosylase family 4